MAWLCAGVRARWLNIPCDAPSLGSFVSASKRPRVRVRSCRHPLVSLSLSLSHSLPLYLSMCSRSLSLSLSLFVLFFFSFDKSFDDNIYFMRTGYCNVYLKKAVWCRKLLSEDKVGQ